MSSPALALVRFAWPAASASVPRPPAAGAPYPLLLCRTLDGGEGYAWLRPDADVASSLAAVLRRAPPPARPVRLECLRELPGASPGLTAAFRYIVETDVEVGHEADFNAWYDDEHLAGLAAVPGTVRALRYRALDDRPLYHAYYDLEHPDVLGSPAWLAVRGTPWSDRVRPRFVNTKRTMFRICR
jgi:hypothetical protein